MREVANTEPIEIHALMNFLCNEALCFDVSERKFVCQEKRSRGTLNTGPKVWMSPPHLPSKGNPATKLSELGARPLLPLPQMASRWPGHSSSQCMTTALEQVIYLTGRPWVWGIVGTSTSSPNYPGILESHCFSHGVTGHSEMVQFLEQLGMTVNSITIPHEQLVAFQRPSEVQSCIVSWSQPLDKHIWTSSRSCSQGW